MKSVTSYEKHALLALCFIGFCLLAAFNETVHSIFQHHLWLSQSFLQGRLDIPGRLIDAIGPMDIALHGNNYYWPLGPLPAILLMPFAGFVGADSRLGDFMHAVTAVVVMSLAYVVARLHGFRKMNALWLAFGFLFSSVAIGVALFNSPWHVSNLLAVALLLAATVEYKGKHRPLVIGIFVALAASARITAGLGIVFFALIELLSAADFKKKIRRLTALLLPCVAIILLLGAYNFGRFGTPFDNGQGSHYLQPGAREEVQRSHHGLFHPINVPRNFFYYFVNPPYFLGRTVEVNHYGIGFFYLSPLFLWLSIVDRRSVEARAAAVTTAVFLAVFLSYFTTGFSQFGPRYLLDIMPFWFLLLLMHFKTRGFHLLHKTVIASSAVLNVFLFTMYFGG